MFDSCNRRIHYLRISVTDLCNLRCTYCMPAEGVQRLKHQDILSFEEIRDVVQVAVDLGVDKVRLTGGEPLVRRGIIGLVEMLGAIEGIKDFAMTTNALLLPKYADDLWKHGIRRLNISLDTLDPDRFRELTRGGEVEQVLAGLDAAAAAGFSQIKLNCVIEDSVDEPDAVGVANFAEEHGYIAQFIKRMETRNGRFSRVIGGDGGHCEACNRLRLSADGKIYPCLFSDHAFSVRELGAEGAIRAAVAGKPSEGGRSKNEFYAIGG